MALRDQPYLPLYIKDFMTDEKLTECSAESTGVYIRLMCLLHKSDPYGTILLKQKYKQNAKQILNFASQVAKNLPYDLLVVERAFSELYHEDVIQIDGDILYQKRMVKDGDISIKRSKSGGKGGKNTQAKNKEFALKFAKAKTEANYVNANEYESVIENVNKEGVQGEKFLIPQMWEVWKSVKPKYPADKKKDFIPLKKIGEFICGQQRIDWMPSGSTETALILDIWRKLGEYIDKDKFFAKYSLEQVERHIQSISQSFQENKPKTFQEVKNESDDYIDEMFKKSEFNGR